MKLLRDTLGPSPSLNVWYQAQDVLEKLLLTEVLMRCRFTTSGAAQLQRDLTAIWAIIDAFALNRISVSAAASMPKLSQGAYLLNLPLTGNVENLALTEAVNGLNADSNKVSLTMTRLRCWSLSPHEARLILSRRVEVDSKH